MHLVLPRASSAAHALLQWRSKRLKFLPYLHASKVKTMKSSLKFIAGLISVSFAITASTLVVAQDKTAPPPPKLEKLEEAQDSDVKLIKQESNKLKTVERKENGKVSEVQVRSGKSTYTVKPNNASKGTPEGDANRAAQWKVMEFGGKKQSKEVESLPVLPVGPNSTSKIGSTKSLPANPASASASAATAASTAASAEATTPPVKK
jgi:hypothetical protein